MAPLNKKTDKPAPKAEPKRGPSPIPTKAPGEFPMRINKYLAWKGYSTRRGADDLIQKNQVTINGRFAALGDKVEETDDVHVRKFKRPDEYVYYAFNKPRGVTTEATRKGGTPDIMQTIALRGVFPVGGLDANAQGLVILTNDRRIVDRLLNPAHKHMKEFAIKTLAPVRANFKEKMESGVIIGGAAPIECSVHIIRPDFFTVRVTDSGNHIRQMCSMFFAEIESMTRTQIMNIRLGGLALNTYRKLDDDERTAFLKGLGL